MELREFVAQTLTQIVEGIASAQTQVARHGATVNPYITSSREQLGRQGFLHTLDGSAQVVQFDVALTILEGTGTKGGIGVFAGVVTLGSAGESQKESTSTSRVKFGVPMLLPGAQHNSASSETSMEPDQA